mgnify:CR=1 FL=1
MKSILGRINYLSFQRQNLGPIRNDVDVDYDLTSHDLSIINKLFGKLPKILSYKKYDILKKGIADISNLHLRLDNIFIDIKRNFINLLRPFFLKRYKIAAIMNELIISGIDLMLTGMVTVLIFLSILIILINISATIFKEDLKDTIDRNKNTNTSVSTVSNSHKEIINIINKRIFNE